MTEAATKPGASGRWTRPVEGRRVSGVCAALAGATGLGVGLVRAVFVIAAILGPTLFVAFGIFDHALFGEFAAPALRVTVMVLAALMLLAYPLLALLLPNGHRKPTWDFGSSLGMALVLVAMGKAIGTLVTPWWDAAESAWRVRGPSGFFTWVGEYSTYHGFGLRDIVLCIFFVSAVAFVVTQRQAVLRYFRAMHTGVTLVVLSTLAVTAGVLVPQIEGFEDPNVRVDLAQEQRKYEVFAEYGFEPAEFRTFTNNQYRDFRWAEGYFFYHLAHLYGVGMPEGELSDGMKAGLETYGDRYGREEADNRRKLMTASTTGRLKTSAIEEFIAEHEHSLWRGFQLSTLFELNRTYKSAWFAFLLALLGCSIASSAFRGRPSTWVSMRKLGFFTVHCGMLVMLFGGCTSRLFTERGILELYLGRPPIDRYFRFYDPRQVSHMPFAVGLQHFARQDWKSLEVHFPEEGFRSTPPRYTLWEGRSIDLDFVDDGKGGTRPRIRLVVDGLHEKARPELPDVREAGPDERDGSYAVAEVMVNVAHGPVDDPNHDHAAHAQRVYLLPMAPSTAAFRDPAGGFRLSAAHGAQPERMFPTRDGELGDLLVRIGTGSEANAKPFRVRLGDTLELEDGWRLEVVGATADFDPSRGDDLEGSKNQLPLEQQAARRPAVWVDITPPPDEDGVGEVERRLIIEGIDPVQHGFQSSFDHVTVEARLRWDTWSAPGPPRYLLHWEEGVAGAKLLPEVGVPLPVELDESLPLPGDTTVVPRQLLHHAAFESRVDFLPEVAAVAGWDQDFYSKMPRGLEMSVIMDPDTPEERTERIRMASTPDYQADWWSSPDKRFVLHFLENSEMLPYEWRSVLTIHEKQADGSLKQLDLGPEPDREIRVNDYLYYGGYRFFQTNARAEDPTYSGIGVVYDPGIPWVLFGMYTIIAGTAIAFLVRPIVLAGRERKTA
jgi:phage shock protein PspC (stress-responsive transcriptional regulator)